MIGAHSKHGGEKFKRRVDAVYWQYFRKCIRCLTDGKSCQSPMTDSFNHYIQFASESSIDVMEPQKIGEAESPKHPRPLPRTSTLISTCATLTPEGTSGRNREQVATADEKWQTPLVNKHLRLLDDYPIAISTPKNETSEADEASEGNVADSSITLYERKTSTSTTASSDCEPPSINGISGIKNDSSSEAKENRWLSKSRKTVHQMCTSSDSPSSGRSSPSFVNAKTTSLKIVMTDNNGLSAPKRSHNLSHVHEQRQIKLTLDYDAILRLDKLKLALNYVGVEPTNEQWNTIRSSLQASDASLVRFGDFVNAVKDVLEVEMDLKGITTGSIFFAASNIDNIGAINKNQAVESSQLGQLKLENQELHEQLNSVKARLHERLEACLLAEKEILFVRKTLQEVIEDNRTLSSRLSSLEAEKSQHVQLQKAGTFSDIKKSPHQEIYLVAASKLLQFTKVVHEVLSDQTVNQYTKQRSLTRSETTSRVLARKPIRINRAASVQSASGDVSSYFARKYGGGGRICRAATTCTVSHKTAEKENSSCTDSLQSESKNKLFRLAEKAQELITVFEAVLPAESRKKSTKEVKSYIRRTQSAKPGSNTYVRTHIDSESEVTIAWV